MTKKKAKSQEVETILPIQNLLDKAKNLCELALREKLFLWREDTDIKNVPTWECARSSNQKFGDYQCNIAMLLAKSLKKAPRQIAEEIIEKIKEKNDAAFSKIEVAGAGFINFFLDDKFVNEKLAEVFYDKRLGTPKFLQNKKIVIDFSSPNVAKPMHVGHLRSSIIGESLARCASFAGAETVRVNHLGDWGSQFGMIIYGWKNFLKKDAFKSNASAELSRIYKKVNALCQEDEKVKNATRNELAKLQNGDIENSEIWRICVEATKQDLKKIYRLLDISFDHWLGESAYHEILPKVIDNLEKNKIAKISEGALCVFFPDDEFLADKPCIVRKSDGSYLYASTDIAALTMREREWQADEIWYVVGAPQSLHFRQIFAISKMLGHKARKRHIVFGSILGEDGKLMRTRAGESVSLVSLLKNAQKRALEVAKGKTQDLPETLANIELKKIADLVGVAAVKYADLAQNRESDYIFSWQKMLSLNGNTAPYLLYSYARCRAIIRKAEASGIGFDGNFNLKEKSELALAKRLLQFPEAVGEATLFQRPNILAAYAYDCAKRFHAFYEQCPALKAANKQVRNSRLSLCDLNAKILAKTLELLSIKVLEKM